MNKNALNNDLRNAVNNICSELSAKHQLVTNKTVRNLISLHGEWSEVELDLQLPRYVNEWRLSNLAVENSGETNEHISHLEALLCKYRTNLHHAEQTISQLKAELVAAKAFNKQQRSMMIQELRNMLKWN